MDRSARKVRQELSADGLFKLIRQRFDQLTDARAESAGITLTDALMSAFAMFSLKDPSLLAFDQRRQDPSDNFRTVYGIKIVPCDTQMRTIVDPVDPAQVRPLFQDLFRCLQRGKRWNRSPILTDIIWCRSTVRAIFRRKKCIVNHV